MTERERAITNLMAVDLRGGSHEMLSSIAKAIHKPTCGGWTIGACQVLRDTLVNLLSETDEEALREAYTKGREDGMGVANKADMRAEYLRGRNDGYDEGWDAGLASADDWLGQHEDAMAEHGWVRLPKDTDGEYIHIGDVIEWCDSGETLEVVGIGADDTLFYFDKDSDGEEMADWTSARNKRHHKQPTVEDVLREFAQKMNENVGMYTSEAIDADEWRQADSKTIAEYAAKLRLAGDAE